jgi:V8-like Glu-specific endopeptidase
LIVSTSISESFGQVITRVLSPEDKIENYIPWYNPEEEIPMVNAPFVDVEAVLLEDQQTGREMPRIGIKQDVNYTTEDGRLIEKGNYSLWGMTLRSVNAKSMSVRFDNSNLPESAIMYLFNEESRFIVGPIKKRDFRNGTFRSDYLNGDHVSIQVFIPRNQSSEELSTYISSYDHGILSFKSFDDDFESSGECNNNIACETGWDCQSDAVCKIIHSTIGSCTGTLVNNDCCDLTPFILTADHCTAGRPVDDYIFRFSYQSPQCDPNGETPPSQWIVYFGSDLRANWNRGLGTDFALLELQSELEPNNSPSFAGWDRFSFNTPNSTCIHHPSGDIKKITFDEDMNTINGNYHRIVWDDGTTEPGSSGSPLFDSNSRVIGQLWGGTASCTNQSGWDEYGRIDLSWQGNGTLDSRLRDWLGASTNPNTMDCMDYPSIEGPDILCDEDSEQFGLTSNIPCTKSVQWELSPAQLFNSSTNGTGNIVTVQASPNASGSANITYTLSSEGCNDVELEESFWVGPPQALTTYPDPTICLGQFEQIVIPKSYGASSYSLQSLSPYLFVLTNTPTPYVPVDIVGTQVGIFQLQLTVTNDCGSDRAIIFVEVERCRGDEGGFRLTNSSRKPSERDYDVSIYPNPASDFIEVACSGYSNGARIAASLISTSGNVVRSIEEGSHYFKVDIADLPSGLYVLQLNVNGIISHEKIVKL